jgi:hypothetical protein
MRAGSTIRLARRLRRRGSGPAGVAAVPSRPVRPAERPVHSQPCRCARSVCWEQGRSAAWPMPFRPGIPPRLRSVPRAHLPTAQRAFPTSESTCVRHGRRPTSPPAGFYALHGMRRPSAPTRHAVAAPTLVAASTLTTAATLSPARGGVCSKEVSPFDLATSGTTGQPGLIATRTLPRISRFARRLGAGAGSGRPLRGRPGGVHVRCRWRG